MLDRRDICVHVWIKYLTNRLIDILLYKLSIMLFVHDVLDTCRQQPSTLYMPTEGGVLMVYFGTPNMFITLWFGFDYGSNPPLGTLII
jgi:hypothetical protein